MDVYLFLQNTGIVTYNQGYRVPKRFDPLSFYPKWESLRVGDDIFTRGEEKFVCDLESIVNTDDIDLKYYMSNTLSNREYNDNLFLKHTIPIHIYFEKQPVWFNDMKSDGWTSMDDVEQDEKHRKGPLSVKEPIPISG